MDDLRRRFASLDQVHAPDLWPEIEARSTATVGAAREVPTARISSPLAGAWRTPRTRSLTLLVAALVAVLVAGTIAVGSGLVRLPTIIAPPSPSPVDITPAPSVTARPSPSVASPAALVAYNISEAVDPAPEGCTRPNNPRCTQERIWVVNADGSAARPLLPGVPGNQHFLAWHPDGARLLYDGDMGTLVLSDLTGSEAEAFPVSETCPVDNCPYVDGIALSPDGTRIVYVLGDSGTEDTTVLGIFDLTSRRLTLLESTRVDGPIPCLTAASQGTNDAPIWSPDGTMIAFVRQGVGPRAEDGFCQSRMLLVDADGTNLREIVSRDLRPLYPRWSPDGSTILFHDSVFPDLANEQSTSNVFVVRPDGTELRRLTDDANSVWPRWSRDGRIIFIRWTSADHDRYDLWWMDADGSGAARLDPSIAALSAAGCIVCPLENELTSGAELFWQPAQ